MDAITSLLTANALLLAILSYLGVEIRRDTRETRDKVLILWDHHQRQIRFSDPPKEI